MLDQLKAFLAEIGEIEGKYLASCFFQNGSWKIDFYSKEAHKIYTYEKINGQVRVKEDKIFQKEKKELERLDLENVKFGYDKALEKIELKEKAIVILQVVNGTTIWNITILTPEFKVINIKVNATTGEVIKESEENILNFKKDGLGLKL
jgi:uncharacterized membrane protein YkoI